MRLDIHITFYSLAHHQFMDVKSEKHKMHFLVKNRVKIPVSLTRFSEPQPIYLEWFRLLILSYDHFVKPKAENYKIQFLVTKRGKKFNTMKLSDP